MTNFRDQVTLFVVEDDDVDFMTIERSFRKQRIANPIVRAKNGEEALEMLLAGKPDFPFVALLDLQMPKLSGLELLSKIRSDPRISDTVVFVLTTSKDEQDILQSYQHHVAGYFVKEDAGEGFMDIVSVLEGYWKVVHFAGQGLWTK